MDEQLKGKTGKSFMDSKNSKQQQSMSRIAYLGSAPKQPSVDNSCMTDEQLVERCSQYVHCDLNSETIKSN